MKLLWAEGYTEIPFPKSNDGFLSKLWRAFEATSDCLHLSDIDSNGIIKLLNPGGSLEQWRMLIFMSVSVCVLAVP